jgi:HAE1 family hydrophobic/amphiphilic exporter-1
VNIAELFIRRPVMTTLVMLGILVFGVMSYRSLPVSDLPNVDFPTLQVSAQLPGGSPETMASSVATPLEREFSTIAGIDSMTSSSVLGSTQITLQFALNRNIDAAAQDVQAAIARAARRLPPDMPTPPSYRKVNPADQPVLYLALTSQLLPLYALNEYADTLMAQRISMVAGVAQVNVYGAQKKAVRIQLDPQKLAARQIGIDEVEKAVVDGNVNLPTGTLYGEHQALTIEASGQLMDADAYRPLIVCYRNGNPVHLGELGRVIDSVEVNKTAAWFRGERSVVLAIQRQPGTNTVEVVDSIKQLLPTFQKQLPASVSIRELYDRSASIRDSVNDVKFTLWLTLSLVVLVIFLFLRNLRATIIPSIAMPMSLVGTFVVMGLLGFSLDNMSLMALTLSVGFVVDDAIVMLENIVRHMELGESIYQAALHGSREIGFTIVSMTLSLVAVFIPVLFMGGIVGRLLNEFAITIAVAILVSGVVSLSLTPMLCSRFLRPPSAVHHGHLYAVSERFFQGMLAVYDWGLRGVLRFRLTTMAVSAVILVGTVWLFKSMPTGFLPSEDTGRISVSTEAAEGISFDALVRHQKELAAIVQADGNVESFMSAVGGGGGASSSNTGRMFVKLKPRKERKLSADQFIQALRPKLAQVPGIRAYMQNPPPIQIGGLMTKSMYQYTLQGPDMAELFRTAPLLADKVRELPGFQDVTTDLQIKNPQIAVQIDREKASTLGISASQIESALANSYAAQQVSTIYAPNNQYQVILEMADEYQTDAKALALLYVRSAAGQLVPLEAVARLVPEMGPLSVNHAGQLPAVTISFNLKPGYALGDAVASVEKLARDMLPDTISTSFQGAAQAFQSSLKNMYVLLIMAIMVIYMVLGILYESFIHPLTILSALPFAGFGALVTLRLFNVELSLYAFVGIIMLVGLVKKNGIMMVDFALEAQRAGKLPAEAIHEACLVRFRPIMMTTMAALMGTLPIALGMGAGAESRRPLGLAVVGGLLFSQLLTLFVTPVFYVYMEKLRALLSRKQVRHPAAAVPAVVRAEAARVRTTEPSYASGSQQ